MKRFTHAKRPDWEKKCEEVGFTFHTFPEGIYWDESVHYEFTSLQIDELENASNELYARMIDAVDYVIKNNLFHHFDIPEKFWNIIRKSWTRQDLDLYGRFDFAYDGINPPKLLEFNADTPTSLLEASVVQWFWQEEFFKGQKVDQFNSIHETLIEAWKRFKSEYVGVNNTVYFGVFGENTEDICTVNYLRDTATQAGINPILINMSDIGWNGVNFTDLNENQIDILFKLYPWEWLVEEQFGEHLLNESSDIIEPIWKMILSNKAILPILWKLFPNHPNLLKSEFTPDDFNGTYVSKPKLSREGANVKIVKNNLIIEEEEGHYSTDPSKMIYQEYSPLPNFDGNIPVIGSWIVAGRSVGIGIRETEGLITGNNSKFVPHIFKGE